jgi:hypothetical protein
LILILHLVGFCCHMCSTSLYQGRPGWSIDRMHQRSINDIWFSSCG